MTERSAAAKTTIVVGNPKPTSRSLQAARTVVRSLTGRGADDEFDLVEFGGALLDLGDARVAEAAHTVAESDLAVVATPTYQGTCTGPLKLFLDRFGAGSLTDATAVPLFLGGDWRHSLAPEVFLKPVLAELGASVPTRGLFLLDSDPTGSALSNWPDIARQQIPARLLSAASPTEAPA
ncbi:NAD(P)H-dependent oxidoreductase [Streptomyces sp. NRRL B-2790]|uniref:NADPH-dependent FMN reductase n=1 Tax=Streptomyces sp. NRRL B-2790 TaxID=1463835 RepID=UPI000AE7FA45